MGQKLLAQLLCIILAFSVPVPTSARDAPPAKPTIQEKVVLIQAGSIVEVKTKDKKKIQGRLLAVGNESFDVQSAKGQTIDKQTFRFEDVTSIKQIEKEGGMSTAGKITVGALAGIGVFFVVLIVIAAAHGWG